ncbi:MAG: TIGR04283 family arsenosugar biosynthesis glycosyltransferase [Maribacter sp.]
MVSILIPSHNEFHNLKRLFDRVDFLEDKEVEVIVATSPENTDHTQSLAKDRNITVLSCKKKGRAAQMNEAAHRAVGDTFVFLHADVIPPKGFISDIKRSLKSGYTAGFFSYKFDSDRWLLQINAAFTAKDGIFTGGGDQCLFIKKDVFTVLGGFDEKQVLMEDFEFFRRMKKNKVPYTIVKNDLVVSARKYECNSYLRINLSNLVLVLLFKLGYPGEKLKALHQKLIRTPYNG